MNRIEAFGTIAAQAARGDISFPTSVNAVLRLQQALNDPDCHLEEAPFDQDAIDRRHESMRAVIRTGRAVRLGFRQVKGLSEAVIEKLMANRGHGYISVRDLWLRSGLQKSEMEHLADADAFHSIGLARREALWAVRALDAKSAAEKLPLFERADNADLQLEPSVSLPRMLPGEEVIEDYRALSLSLKAHPVSFLRSEFIEMGITRNVDLLNVRNGRAVTIAGLVLVRQRPGSARGVVFMTLEDETGVSNAIVWTKIFEKYRSVVMGARLVKIRGKLQSASGVIHVVVEHIEDMTHVLGLLQKEARRFGASERSDEVLRPTIDQRQKKPTLRLLREKAAFSDREHQDEVTETARVMPRGRNFH